MSKISKGKKRFNDEILIVTIDVGKLYNYGYGRTTSGKELPVFSFSNTGNGYEELLSRLRSFKEKHGLKRCIFGLEATGSYGLALIHFLKRKGLEVVQVNPMHTKRVKELTDNSPNKTDRKDPKVIADIIELGNYLQVIVPRGAAAELRGLVQLREQIKRDIHRNYNRIEALLFAIFPEFFRVMKDIRLKTSRYLLGHYTTPESIVNLGVEELAAIMERISKKRLGRERAEEYFKAAQSSGGKKEGVEIDVMGILHYLEIIEQLEIKKRYIEQKMGRILLERIPYSKNILSIKGVGLITTATLIGEVGDLKEYRSYHEVEKLAGLSLYEISSGLHKGSRHITKRGRSLLRRTLYFMAINVVRERGILYDVYQMHLSKGMAKPKALTAVSRKLLAIIFALVRDNTIYEENHKRLNKAA